MHVENQRRWAPLVFAGLAGGTFCTGLALSALRLNPISIEVQASDVVTAGATLVGAVVGATVSILGTLLVERNKARRHAKVNAMRLVLKLGQMTSTLLHFQHEFEKAKTRIRSQPRTKLWQVVHPTIARQRTVEISFDELLPLIEGKSLLQGDLIDLERAHDNIGEAWAVYCTGRRDLLDIMPIDSVELDGSFFSTVDPTKHPAATMRVNELQTLLESIIAGVDKWAPKSEAICDAIGDFLRLHFEDPKFPKAAFREGD